MGRDVRALVQSYCSFAVLNRQTLLYHEVGDGPHRYCRI